MSNWITHIHTVRDARGRRVVLYDPRSLPASDDPLLRGHKHNLHALAREQAGYRKGFFVGCAFLAVVIVGQGIVVPLRQGKTEWFVVGVVLGLTVLVTAFMRIRSTGISRHVVAEMLAQRHCPSCAYNLAGLDSSSDGLITCPECGSAWPMAQDC
ncbi:MAG TPA: hypothetical protein PKE29_06750 [Phycisphaerales bacterium]|nr:hypothetical protein [Phycisphaerales bacterium]